jgi:Fe(3+) dicitrate transport protein
MTPQTLPIAQTAPSSLRRAELPVALGLAILAIGGNVLASADAGNADADAGDLSFLPRINVVGQAEDAAALIPGAVTVVTAEEIDQLQPRSTEDVLRRVPGIHVKSEEESAVVTNIGVRGLTAGDYKTLVLEDGVPIQPGIFVGNSRYYNPRIQRMEGVEVLRGAASLRYGPNTIGGVINFLTRTPEDGAVVSARVGSWNSWETTVELGASPRSGDARFGLVATRAESDGFMDKGHGMTDAMVKAGMAIGDDQFVGVKFAYYRSTANISYRGIFPDAFAARARFNPAPDDFFLSGRSSFDLNHRWDITADARLETLAYVSETFRDYWRFATPSGAAATTTNADGFRVWNYNNNINGNNRAFSRVGIDSRLNLIHTAFGLEGEAEFGLRLMQEEMDDVTVAAVRGRPRTPDAGRGGITQDRLDSAGSLALFAQNRFDISNRLSITAGVRVESYEQERKDRRSSAAAERYSNTEVMPGLGATYTVNDALQVFGSVYRAFAPPLVGSVLGAADVPTDAEKSLNVEFGLRGSNGPLSYSATVFQMDFSNQVDPGVSGIRAPHQGSAMHRGLEAGLGYDLGHGFRFDGNVSWIPEADYREDRPGQALKGNRLAYSPERLANLSLGYETGALRAALLFNYVSEQFGDGMNRRALTTGSTGTWGGLIPSYSTVDLTTSYAINDRLSLSGAVKNLADRHYIAGLRQGIYVGAERSYEVGVRYQF